MLLSLPRSDYHQQVKVTVNPLGLEYTLDNNHNSVEIKLPKGLPVELLDEVEIVAEFLDRHGNVDPAPGVMVLKAANPKVQDETPRPPEVVPTSVPGVEHEVAGNDDKPGAVDEPNDGEVAKVGEAVTEAPKDEVTEAVKDVPAKEEPAAPAANAQLNVRGVAEAAVARHRKSH